MTRIEHWLKRGWLTATATDCDKALLPARTCSGSHTERLGCRGFDLPHVAVAFELECDTFLTADPTQGALAGAEGLDVRGRASE